MYSLAYIKSFWNAGDTFNISKPGAQFDRKKTQIYGHFLNHLAKSNKGKLTSKEVVNRARSEDSPIHDCFEWNDDKAAEGFRIKQAQDLMNHLQIVIKYNGEEKIVPMFINLVIEEGGKFERRYVQTEIVAKDENLRRQAIEQALKELISWQKRYKDIQELGKIFSAIKEIQQTLDMRIEEKNK